MPPTSNIGVDACQAGGHHPSIFFIFSTPSSTLSFFVRVPFTAAVEPISINVAVTTSYLPDSLRSSVGPQSPLQPHSLSVLVPSRSFLQCCGKGAHTHDRH